MEDDRRCLECMQLFESPEFVRRHIKCHGITLEAYVLKHVHNDIRPTCACGCNLETTWSTLHHAFQRYVHTHHLRGHTVSAETRAKIGAANSVNATAYWKANPELAKSRGQALRAKMTSEDESRRIANIRASCAAMSTEDRQKFSDHAKRLWREKSDVMHEAHTKASTTLKQRIDIGEITFEKRNRKLSEKITQLYVDGGFAWARGKHLSSKTGREHVFRSSWEKQYFELLDTDDDVITWRSEPFSISYELDGKQRRYVPDVIVTRRDRVQLIEVKPEKLRSTAMNEAKRVAAMRYCIDNDIEYVEWQPTVITKRVDLT